MKEKYKFFSNILQTFFIETILWFSGVVWETEYEAIIPKAISKIQKMLLTSIVNIAVKTKNLPNCYIDEIEGSRYLSIKTNIF